MSCDGRFLRRSARIMSNSQNDATLAATLAIARPNPLLETMRAGKMGFSFGITMAHSTEVVHLAKIAGFTAILLNLEHQRTNIETAAELCCAALNHG
jgi:hypothetical protein